MAGTPGSRAGQRYLAVAALFAAGLASKPMVITLPFVLLLLDYWPLARVRGGMSRADRVLTAPVVAACCWRSCRCSRSPPPARSSPCMRSRPAERAHVREVSFGVRIANAIYAYAMYLWKMVWPARLAPLYPHPGDSLAAWQVLIAAVVLIAITAMVWRLRARRYLLVGWLWFLGTLVPVIGLVQVGDAAMADRYAYIPLIGIFVMIAFGAADWAESKRSWALACRFPPRQSSLPCRDHDSSPDRILAEQLRFVVAHARGHAEQFHRGR